MELNFLHISVTPSSVDMKSPVKCWEYFCGIPLLYRPRTSEDMDGTLKFVNYKVGKTQNSYSFTETKYFLGFICENTLLCI